MENKKKVYAVTYGDDYERIISGVFETEEKAKNKKEEMNKEDPETLNTTQYAEVEEYELK